MSNIKLAYTTRLETVAQEDSITAILDAKLEATSPARTVDYVGLALDNIDRKIDDIDKYIKELQDIKKSENARKEHIQEEVCEWLEGTGLDKLEGTIVSSITVNVTKPKENIIVTDEYALINQGFFKKVLDKTAVKNALLDDNIDVDGATIEVIHVANKIKVNEKRTK